MEVKFIVEIIVKVIKSEIRLSIIEIGLQGDL